MKFKNKIILWWLEFTKHRKEDTGLRGTYQGRLYVDKKVFYKRKCVQDNINSIKKWYYQNYT